MRVAFRQAIGFAVNAKPRCKVPHDPVSTSPLIKNGDWLARAAQFGRGGAYRPASARSLKRLVQFSRKPLSYVLDGILENDTILKIREHRTDTWGLHRSVVGTVRAARAGGNGT
jgi:hypothetical protein